MTGILDESQSIRPRSGLANWLRGLIYPGLDLHVRNRASLRRYWKQGARDVLDAGSGNGYFSWLAYKSGGRVLALNIDAGQVARARDFFLNGKGADPARLEFEQRSLYDLDKETRTFDEIICFETLEHLRHDREVLTQFRRVLRKGGYLHLCCPNRLHPRHLAEVLDLEECGGHVRAGYTEEDYRALLDPLGFSIDRVVGIGPWSLYRADAVLRSIRSHVGDLPALPLFPWLLPTVWFARENPPTPFSLYIRAVN